MKYDFIVFGGTGIQGRICSRDLLESGHSVLMAGRNKEAIKDLLDKRGKKAGFIEVDLRNQGEIENAIRKSNCEIVVNCAELTYNIQVMKACLRTGRSCTDLGGLQKITAKQFKLDSAFKKSGILCITGCGSTPGIVNVMAKHAARHFDSIDNVALGFAWDSNIKKFVIPYSIQSIFDEFTEAPVTFHNGKFVKESRMFCRGVEKFKAIGKQIVYCIVHSEVYTFPRYFKNKGLKNIHYMAGFPKHSYEVIKMLLDLGFNSEKEIEINGAKITPLEFTIKVLKKLLIPKGYKEIEDLWVKIDGIRNGKKHAHEMDCITKTTKGWEEAGSNVDTGRTISIMSQMLYKKMIRETGVHAPEAVVPTKAFFKELAKRKMFVYEDGRKIN